MPDGGGRRSSPSSRFPPPPWTPITMRHPPIRTLTYGPCTQVRGCRRRTLICIIGRVLWWWWWCECEQGAGGEREQQSGATGGLHGAAAGRGACERASGGHRRGLPDTMQQHTLSFWQATQGGGAARCWIRNRFCPSGNVIEWVARRVARASRASPKPIEETRARRAKERERGRPPVCARECSAVLRAADTDWHTHTHINAATGLVPCVISFAGRRRRGSRARRWFYYSAWYCMVCVSIGGRWCAEVPRARALPNLIVMIHVRAVCVCASRPPLWGDEKITSLNLSYIGIWLLCASVLRKAGDDELCKFSAWAAFCAWYLNLGTFVKLRMRYSVFVLVTMRKWLTYPEQNIYFCSQPLRNM